MNYLEDFEVFNRIWNWCFQIFRSRSLETGNRSRVQKNVTPLIYDHPVWHIANAAVSQE